MTSARPTAASRASFRVRAALAAGLVLGLGAGFTVASWADAEIANGTFTASSFDLEVDAGAGFVSTESVIFSPIPGGIYPGSAGTVYRPVHVRTSPGSLGGSVSIAHDAIPAPGTGLTSFLRYRIVTNTTGACNAAAFSATATYVAGSPVLAVAPLVSSQLPASTLLPLGASGAGPRTYCFEFSLAATGVPQTLAGSVTDALTWTLSGTSS